MTRPRRALPQLPCWRAKADAAPRWTRVATPVLTILVILTLLPFAASALSPSRGPVAGTLGSAPSGAVSFSVSPSLSPHLVIEVLASDSAEVNNVLSLAPHLRAGDYIDLYQVLVLLRCQRRARRPDRLRAQGGRAVRCGH